MKSTTTRPKLRAAYGALVLASSLTVGCSGPVTHIPEPSYQSYHETRTAFSTFDARKKERQVGVSANATFEAVERVRQRVMPAAQRVCARYFSSGCPTAFSSMKVRVFPQDETINAFAAIDGTLGFYGGFVRLTGNDDELAAVMAHEVAHILFGHNTKAANNEDMGMLGGALLGLAVMGATGVYNEGMGNMTESFMKAGAAAGRIIYSPEMELEADHFAVFVLAEAGYDPEKGGKVFVRMSKTLQGDQQAGRRSFVSYFGTHPANDFRLAAWQEAVAAVYRGQSTPMTSEQVREAAAERRRAHAETMQMNAERERWRVFLSDECRRVHARYPDCAMFTAKFKLFAECPPVKGVDAFPLKVRLHHEECVCPNWALFGTPVSECKPPPSIDIGSRYTNE